MVELELEDGEYIVDTLIMVEVQVITNKGEHNEGFHSLDDAQEFLDKVAASLQQEPEEETENATEN